MSLIKPARRGGPLIWPNGRPPVFMLPLWEGSGVVVSEIIQGNRGVRESASSWVGTPGGLGMLGPDQDLAGVRVPYNPAYQPGFPITLEAIVIPSTTTAGTGPGFNGTILANDSDFPGTGRYSGVRIQQSRFNADYEVRIGDANGTGSGNQLTFATGFDLVAGNRYHLIATFRGVNAGEVETWVNGRKIANTRSGSATALGYLGNDASVGNKTSVFNTGFPGQTEFAAIYDYALSDSEIFNRFRDPYLALRSSRRIASVVTGDLAATAAGAGASNAALSITTNLEATAAGTGAASATFAANYPEDITPLNGGAESGDASNWTDDGDTAAPQQWSAETSRTGGLGTVNPQAGTYLFTPGGPNTGSGTDSDVEMYQEVDVSEFANDIDFGKMLFDMSWYEASAHDNNRLYVYAEMRDGPSGTILDTIANSSVSPPVTPSILTATWREASISGTIPTGTRTIRYRFRALDNDNDDQNGVTLDAIAATIDSNGKLAAIAAGAGGVVAALSITGVGDLVADADGLGAVSANLSITPRQSTGFGWTVGFT